MIASSLRIVASAASRLASIAVVALEPRSRAPQGDATMPVT
jgi:hypothetical protein